MRKTLIIIMASVFFVSFAYGAMAQGGMQERHKPVIKCMTIQGAVDVPAGHESGLYACNPERSFRLDLCLEESRIYDCFYRFQNGVCTCWCKPCCLCI